MIVALRADERARRVCVGDQPDVGQLRNAVHENDVRRLHIRAQFMGFLPPVGGADATGGSFASPVRTFKFGSSVPVKFKLSCDGSAVTTGVHTLEAIKWSSETTAGTPLDATPIDSATIGNQFRLTENEWHFNLDTKATGMTTGKWQLIATLSDGSQHSVWIQLK